MHIQATSRRVFKVDTEFLKKYLDTSKNPGMPPGKTDGDALEKKVAWSQCLKILDFYNFLIQR